jgi:hypothetical protein
VIRRAAGRRTTGMRGVRQATGRLAISGVVLATLAVVPGRASAQLSRPDVDRQVLVFLVDRVSFDELLAVPEIRALARAGGAAFMSPRTVRGDQGGGAYLTLGTGARSIGPESRVLAFHGPELFDGRRTEILWERAHPGRDAPLGPFLLFTEAYEAANEGRSVPGLLGDVLTTKGRTMAVFGNADDRTGRNRPGVLMGMNGDGAATGGRLVYGTAPALGPGGDDVRVEIAPAQPDLLGGARLNLANLQFLALGAEVPNPSPFLPRDLTVFDMGDTLRLDTEAPFASDRAVVVQRRQALASIGVIIERMVQFAAADDVMVMVVAPSPSSTMNRAKDELTPIVIARGDPLALFPEEGGIRTFTSDTTRRLGLVSNEDVAATILRFFQIRVPAEMNGSPVHLVDHRPPLRMHARHLLNRQMTVPVQAGAGIAVTLLGLAAIALLILRRRVPPAVGWVAPVLVLAIAPLAVALLAAGDLDELRYGRVIPFVVAAAVGVALLALPLRLFGPLYPAAAVGLVVLTYFTIEAESGWTATLWPFLGGSALDGARFYGMPNIAIGLLLGAGVFVATVLPAVVGFILLFFVGLFVGLPDIGANLDGALTLFVAAGLWLALRTRPRFGWVEAGMVILTAVLGMVLVFLAHAFLTDAPTHGSRFIEDSGGGVLGILGLFGRRLADSWALLIDVPFAFIPVIGLPIVLIVTVKGPGVVGESLERHPEWRHCIIVIAVSSALAFLVNDSGPAAAGLGFAMALAAILYLPLVEQRWSAAEA